MEMTLRWYGSKFDTVTLKQIRQIPGVTGVITTLYDTQPGEVWDRERIRGMKDEVEASGLHIAGIKKDLDTYFYSTRKGIRQLGRKTPDKSIYQTGEKILCQI